MSINEEITKQHMKQKFIYSIIGLLIGLICILGGIFLFLKGVSGSTNWTAKILGNESQITDAAPGAVLFIIGLFLVIVTRYKVKIENDKFYHKPSQIEVEPQLRRERMMIKGNKNKNIIKRK